MSLKIMTIVGTRPEIIKLSRVMHEIEAQATHVLVHTGQNYDYELNEVFFQQLGIRRPNHFLNAVGETLAHTIGNIIAKSDDIMEQERPDAVIMLGDTNSCLSAISAKRRKIPIFHMEAGNRCFDMRVPEEINRKIVDHLSDINMTHTEHARRYLLAEGIRPETVMKSGSPMKEVLDFYRPQIEDSNVLASLKLTPGNYFVLSAHREENIDSPENFKNLIASVNAIAKKYALPIIFSTHPRTRKRLEERGSEGLDPLIQFLKPMGFFEYVKLQLHAKCVVSDSGTITEESTILNFPAVTIRQAHERPEGMDEGTVIMSGLAPQRVLGSIALALAHQPTSERSFRLIPDYDTDNVSKKVMRIIYSYVDYVNRTVWKKN